MVETIFVAVAVNIDWSQIQLLSTVVCGVAILYGRFVKLETRLDNLEERMFGKKGGPHGR